MNMLRNHSYSMLKTIAVSFLVICLSFALVQRAPAEAPAGTDSSESAETVRIMNLNLRYILNTWWTAEKDFVYAAATNMNSDQQLTVERKTAIADSARAFADWRNADLLPILYLSREQAENGIRPVGHAIYCISLALQYGYYDEEITGVPQEDAEAMCIKLINSIVAEHRTNHFEKMREQIYRETDGEITGQFFQKGENFFVSGELFMMHNLAEAYVQKPYGNANET